MHFLGWYIPVSIGHEKHEPPLIQGGKEVSTNIYFYQQIFILKNLGKKPSLMDAWLQYSIAPFYATFELLSSSGFMKGIQNEVDIQMQYNLECFALGKSIYPAEEPVLQIEEEFM